MDSRQEVAALSPTYKQTLQEAGKQLSMRKSQLVKRVFLYSWPGLISIFIWNYFLKYWLNERNQNNPHFLLVASLGLGWIVLTIFYILFFESIFNIERRVWIDSYFDGKNLDGNRSWKIAKKLLLPAALLQFHLFVRYYFFQWVVTILYFIFAWKILFTPVVASNVMLSAFLLLSPFLLLAALAVYFVYLRIKFRFLLFLFLDMYQPHFSYKDYFAVLNKIHKISKAETFDKALVAEFGTASFDILVEMASSALTSGLKQLGGAGAAAGEVVRAEVNEISYQAIDFGKISAFYLLYIFARQQLFGQGKEVNDNIYKLAN